MGPDITKQAREVLPEIHDSQFTIHNPSHTSLLEVRGLRTQFRLAKRTIYAVNDVSFTLAAGSILCLVGESGCGKSVTALSLMGLLDTPGRVVAGQAWFYDEDGACDLLALRADEWERVRGRRLGMIFQDPMTSLNPVLRVGYQIAEPLRVHFGLSRAEARAQTADWLQRVGIDAARMDDYPHRFSGGMRQRVMIALAAVCRPRLLIADEPTTALDVTIQAQILRLLRGLVKELGAAVILITHDLGVVAQIADRVAVMYAGRIVEEAPVAELFAAPQHPYTQALLAARPRLDRLTTRLQSISGVPPRLDTDAPGCAFAPRCPVRLPVCDEKRPALTEIAPGHRAACYRNYEL